MVDDPKSETKTCGWSPADCPESFFPIFDGQTFDKIHPFLFENDSSMRLHPGVHSSLNFSHTFGFNLSYLMLTGLDDAAHLLPQTLTPKDITTARWHPPFPHPGCVDLWCVHLVSPFSHFKLVYYTLHEFWHGVIHPHMSEPDAYF